MTSALIGFYLCNRATNLAGRQFKIGFSLFVIGFWSLICLPYFTGRSFPSTALGGFAIHYSLLFSLLAVLILTNLKQNLHLSKINFASSSLFQIFALSIFISLIMNLNNPINKFRDLKTYNQTSANFSQTLNNLNGLLSDPNSDLKILVKNNQISQALMLSAAIELKTGLKSELITNHPYHIEVSKLYSNLQCVYFDKSDQAFLLVSESTFAALKNDSSCKKSLDFENVQFLVFEESKFVIISKK